ncbi:MULTISPECIES: hypothetical protein [Streptomyces]|uniref:Uncharacterized protein n=1 Tax=Streptomyces nondiastaticus TaxID=3154512 RepID=A0ABW6TVQ6_9ACTN|nr:hypothetical protein [Streptomyces sp. VNUA116]WKU44896.1 hypothetical protein Q3V23_12900 [Streptomyces sp. VNUA116]
MLSTRTWMLRAFAAHREHARHVTALTDMLLGPAVGAAGAAVPADGG